MGFETAYVYYVQERQWLLYEMQCDGSARDLGPVERSLYEAFRDHEPVLSSDQWHTLLGTVAIRGRVDFHPSVSALRNRPHDPSNCGDGSPRSTEGGGATAEGDRMELPRRRHEISHESARGGADGRPLRRVPSTP